MFSTYYTFPNLRTVHSGFTGPSRVGDESEANGDTDADSGRKVSRGTEAAFAESAVSEASRSAALLANIQELLGCTMGQVPKALMVVDWRLHLLGVTEYAAVWFRCLRGSLDCTPRARVAGHSCKAPVCPHHCLPGHRLRVFLAVCTVKVFYLYFVSRIIITERF